MMHGIYYMLILCDSILIFSIKESILAPSRTALSEMIHKCESHGCKYDVKFNTQTTHLVVCNYLNKYSNMSSMTLNGETIIRSRIASHFVML